MQYPHPALAAKAEPSPLDAALLVIGQHLLAAASEAGAYGLAAAHIGEPAPVIVLNTTPDGIPTYALYYNPRVVEVADNTETGREASVSLPGVEADIERPVWAEIAWQDSAGAMQQKRLTGFLARCALHEIEQTHGRFFLQNLSRMRREMVLKKAAKRGAEGRAG